MNTSLKSILFWTPRILGILFAIFISMFALDVFAVDSSFLDLVAGFLIHLIPTAIVIFALIIAWRNGIIGGVMFILIGAAYIFQTRGSGWAVVLIFGGIPILTGILFILEGMLKRREQRPEESLPEGEA